MIKVSVCYSTKSGSDFASCSLGDVELDTALLANPAALKDRIAELYDTCEQMVRAQLGAVGAAAPAPPPANASPPPPPPPVNGHADGKRFGPPTNAKTFSGWISKGAGKQYHAKATELCHQVGYPTWFMNLTDQQAMWLYGQLVGSDETEHEAMLRRQSEKRQDTRAASEAFSRNGH